MGVVIRSASRAFLLSIAVMAVVLYAATAIEMRGRQNSSLQIAALAPDQSFDSELARRFPACLPIELWASDLAPTSLLVLTPRGDVKQIKTDAVTAKRWVRKARVIGVC